MKLLKYSSVFISILVLVSCSTSRSPWAGKPTPHDKYSEGLEDAGLQNTEVGKAWFAAAASSLASPLQISLPFKEAGFFPSDKPSSAGYIFNAKRGEKIVISLSTVPVTGYQIFTELWESGSDGKKSFLTIMDTLSKRLEHEADADSRFVLRIQPELLRSVEYTLTITTAPSLAFPVHKSGSPKLISFWGMDRDGGARSHEGVDISAKFRTPVIAASDGTISRVTENNLGGKVVFMRDSKTGNNLYYAHLDSQIVQSGQRVKTGDILGLVGNTGNARGTVPHLHFGIYAGGGPIDPLAFIDDRRKEPAPITASTKYFGEWFHAVSKPGSNAAPNAPIINLSKGDAVTVIGASSGQFKILLPDGSKGYVSSSTLSNKTLEKLKISEDKKLFDSPYPNAPAKSIIAKGSTVDVKGYYSNLILVEHGNTTGWIH